MKSYLRINFNSNFKIGVKVDFCLSVGCIFEVEVKVEDKIYLDELQQHPLNYFSQEFYDSNRQLWGCNGEN